MRAAWTVLAILLTACGGGDGGRDGGPRESPTSPSPSPSGPAGSCTSTFDCSATPGTLPCLDSGPPCIERFTLSRAGSDACAARIEEPFSLQFTIRNPREGFNWRFNPTPFEGADGPQLVVDPSSGSVGSAGPISVTARFVAAGRSLRNDRQFFDGTYPFEIRDASDVQRGFCAPRLTGRTR